MKILIELITFEGITLYYYTFESVKNVFIIPVDVRADITTTVFLNEEKVLIHKHVKINHELLSKYGELKIIV